MIEFYNEISKELAPWCRHILAPIILLLCIVVGILLALPLFVLCYIPNRIGLDVWMDNQLKRFINLFRVKVGENE
tara:strand:- start:2605 stop:2829 length:225 start_codon:yes stop_codon:yes gene_type:complete